MTILITGGAGYIGGQTVLALLDRGEIPLVLDDLSTGHRAAVPAEVPLVIGDVGDTELVLQLIKQHNVEAILHFAAKIVVAESVADPLKYYLSNTVKTRALLEAATKGAVRHFVFSSTAAVYGNPDAASISEDAPPVPLSPYGRSKLMSEQMLRDVSAAYGMSYAILRYFNVAGADPAGRHGQSTPNATHLIKVAIETALGRHSHMNIYGEDYPTADGTCVRDFVHVADLANAHLAVLDYLQRGGESCILNCGYGRGYSVRQVVETVRRVAGIAFEARSAERRPGDPTSVVANSSRLVRLGWRPALDDLSTIVRHAYEWEIKHSSFFC
ncbi:UDP-glucose 4-epimerase GalE [Bradyrhizobium genosp. P]|uniref:UDP-glucose 4-epimerase GalE n=1 Tax=Bradyrhizobium genosp. P TaxID=83641 RepID=UPI003CE870CD